MAKNQLIRRILDVALIATFHNKDPSLKTTKRNVPSPPNQLLAPGAPASGPGVRRPRSAKMPVFSRANVLVTRHAIPLAAVSAQIHTTGYKSSPKSLKSLFKRVGVYRDKDALVEDLCLNAVHVDTKRTGLVALNKPSSLPVRKSGDSRYSIEELLPRLAEAFEVKELHFVRAPERLELRLS